MVNSFLAILFTYTAYRNLPIATATSIGFSGPLFSISFSILILKEKFPLKKWMLLFLGYIGVLIITNPGQMTFEMAILSSIMANVLAGLGINITKIMTRTEKTVTLILYGSAFNIIISTVCLPFYSFAFPQIKDLCIISLVGALGAFSSFCYTQALRLSSPSFVAPFEYTRLLYAIPVGFLFFSEIPQASTFLGALIIVVAVYSLTVFKSGKIQKDTPLPKPQFVK